MAIRSTGIRPIERNGLRGFGLTLTIDNTDSQAFPSVGPADTAGGAFLPASSAPIPHPAQPLPSEQAIASAGAEIAAASPFYSPWTVKNGKRV